MLTDSFSLEKINATELAINRLNYLFSSLEQRLEKMTTASHPIKFHLKSLQLVLTSCIQTKFTDIKISTIWELTRDTHELIQVAFCDYFIYYDITPVEEIHRRMQAYYEKWTRNLALAYGNRYQIQLSYCVIYIMTDLFFGIFLVQLISLARYSFGMIVGIALLAETIGLKIQFNNLNYHIGELAGGLFQYQILQQYVFFRKQPHHLFKCHAFDL